MRRRDLPALTLLCFALLIGACQRDLRMTETDATTTDSNVVGDRQPVPGFLRFTPLTLDGSPAEFTDFKFIPGTMDFLVLERGGQVHHYSLSGNDATRVGGFTLPVFKQEDCGLISLAFDPDYRQNSLVYFGYCSELGQVRVSRHTFDGKQHANVPSSGSEIISVNVDNVTIPWHHIGGLAFDKQKNLLLLVGDMKLQAQSQDPKTNAGAILRIVPNRTPGESGYQPAAGNPFLGDPVKSPDILALGLRSPWRLLVDANNRIWIGDVGENAWEEINLLTDASGLNFGWPGCEGPCDTPGTTPPLIAWDRKIVEGKSVLDEYSKEDPRAVRTPFRAAWLGVEYSGVDSDRYAGKLTGRVLFGDHCVGWIRTARLDQQNQVTENRFAGHLANATGADIGRDGFIYIATFGSCTSAGARTPGIYRVTLAE